MRSPLGAEELDYRMAVAAVVGAGGQIGGFTLAISPERGRKVRNTSS